LLWLGGWERPSTRVRCWRQRGAFIGSSLRRCGQLPEMYHPGMCGRPSKWPPTVRVRSSSHNQSDGRRSDVIDCRRDGAASETEALEEEEMVTRVGVHGRPSSVYATIFFTILSGFASLPSGRVSCSYPTITVVPLSALITRSRVISQQIFFTLPSPTVPLDHLMCPKNHVHPPSTRNGPALTAAGAYTDSFASFLVSSFFHRAPFSF